jgi:hypothetical protein
MITRDAFGNRAAPTGLKLKKPPRKGLLNKDYVGTNIGTGMGIDTGTSRAYGGRAMTDAINRTSDLTEVNKPESFKSKMGINFNTQGRGTEDGASPDSTSMDVGKVLTGAGSDVVKSIAVDQTKKLVAKQAAKQVAKVAAAGAVKGAVGAGAGAVGAVGTGSGALAAGTAGSLSTAATAAGAVGTAGAAGTAGAVGAGAVGTGAAVGTGVGAGAAGATTAGATTAGAGIGSSIRQSLSSPVAVNALKTLGVGAVAEAGKAFGNTKIKNKKEDAGYSLKGASKGANIGAAIGSFIPGLGTFVGAGIGAGLGSITGLIKGKGKMKERKRQERKDETERKAYNTKIKGIKRREIGKGADIDSYQKLLTAAGQYSNGGKIKFKKGGILKYSDLKVKDGISYLDSLVEPEEKAPSKIFRLKKGGSVKLKPIKKTSKVTKMYKKGGGMSKSGGCGCSSCMKSAKHGGTPKFRRGGKLDVDKQNVILDGPSHDQKNNTGVAGDKGLPIVKNGEKVAEIESNELVLNAEAAKKIDVLKAKINSGDDEAKEELAELLHKELGENTYDYNKKL